MNTPRTKPRRRRWLWAGVAVTLVLVLTPSYVRAYRVDGGSEAPSYLIGDRILVNKAAYDIRLPYTDQVILSLAGPASGDVVLFRRPGADYVVFKRVVGRPGDTVQMRDFRVTINGVPLTYGEDVRADFEHVPEENRLGNIVALESGNGPSHLVSFTPGACASGSFGPVTIPEDHYFLMGDNRGNSEDSRAYGPVPRRRILGRLSRPLGRHR